MQVDETGNIHDPEVISGKANGKCRKKLRQFAEHARYMPAIHEGNAVAVKYVDFWFRSPDRWTGREKQSGRLLHRQRFLVSRWIRQVFLPQRLLSHRRILFVNHEANVVLGD